LHIKQLLLVLVVVLCTCQSCDASTFTLDDIDFLFAENGCIEGIIFLFFYHTYIGCHKGCFTEIVECLTLISLVFMYFIFSS
jgi:hypothetical protein